MDRRSFMLGTAVSALLLSAKGLAFAQEAPGSAPDLAQFPRNETLIIHNPEGVIRNPGWFNNWVVGAGAGISNGLHQLTTDTFWLIDPDAGIEGASENAIYNSLADGLWDYNDDFTEMTAKLKQGIYWSDGVEFTADDVVFTVEKHKATPGLSQNGAYNAQVETVEAPEFAFPHAVLGALDRRLDHGQAPFRGRGRHSELPQ